jgi:DNA-binding transcriptional LysR family regulator
MMTTRDLNFLFVLQALSKERSVSRAAQRLGITQPAVSHALGKLRTTFQDGLFVRATSHSIQRRRVERSPSVSATWG